MEAGTQPQTRPQRGDQLELDVDSLAFGGNGVARLNGFVVFVRRGLPGDTVRARVTKVKRGFAEATALEVLSPGPDRVVAPCPHFGACGGCTSQHMENTAYLDWKCGRLTVALQRAGFAHPPIAPILPIAPHTRRRMDLAARRGTGTLTLGLHRMRGTEIVDLTECAVLHPALFALIAPLRAVLSSLSAVRREASVAGNLLDSGADLLLRTDGPLITQDRVKLTDFARFHALPRISWASLTGPVEAVCVLTPPVTVLSGVTVMPPAGAFLQATREGEAAIIAAVLDGLPGKLTGKSRALELFAGCGTITFALARRLRVLAIEGDEALVSACHTAANQAGLMGQVEIKRRDLARQPFLPKELAAFAAVILDPPHAGAAAQIPFIAQSKVPTVIYVSCDPAALGRDAQVLRNAGYGLEKVTPIDQFLWSARLEAVAVFRLEKHLRPRPLS